MYIALIQILSQVPSGPVDPGYGVPGFERPGIWPQPPRPVDPGYGLPGPPYPPHVGGGPVYPGFPVDPGYGQGQAPPSVWPKPPDYPKPPRPPVGIWPDPKPPRPPGSIWPDPKPPEHPPNRPENPIVLPPDQIWPPLRPGADLGAEWVLIFIPGHGYEWVYIDLGSPKAAEPR